MSFPETPINVFRKYKKNMWLAFAKETVKLLLKFPVLHFLLSILMFIIVLILSVPRLHGLKLLVLELFHFVF